MDAAASLGPDEPGAAPVAEAPTAPAIAEVLTAPAEAPEAPVAPDVVDEAEPHEPPSEGAPRTVHRPRIVEVDVTAVHPDRIEVKLLDGRSGAIPATDFKDRPTPGVGDRIEAAVLARSDPKRVWLSYLWATKARGWERLGAAREAHETLPATVLRVVKGGAVVDVEGQRAFLPSSLVDDHPVDVSTLVGTIVDVTVIDLDESADRVVVSRRDALRRQRRQTQRELLGSLAVGKRTEGTVVAIRDFGVQLDLGGGIRGLVHRSELSWNRFGSITEVVAMGDRVEALVIEIQRGKRRVALSIRELTPDPLESLEVGSLADAEITRLVEYGAFARLVDSPVEGLIHQSELSELPGARPDELVMPGDVVRVKVIEVDIPRRRLGLSVRQALLS